MLRMRRLPALVFCSLGFLTLLLSAGCGALPGAQPPTPYASELISTVPAESVEVERPTATATPTALPATPTPPTEAASEPASPTPTSQTPSQTPAASRTPLTPQPSPTHTRFPTKTPLVTATPSILAAEIQFSSPGPMSKVVSPLELDVYYRNVPSGHLLIELLAEPLQEGQAGRRLVSKLQRFAGGEAFWLTYLDELDFEIARVSEFAVLRFSTFDPYGRPVSVSSLDLLLLSLGASELNPPGNLLQPVTIHEPTKNKLIQGGVLTVSGMARPEGDQILHFELVTQDKRVVGMRDLFTTPAPDGKHIPYTTTIDYQVSAATWVRLTVYYLDPRIPGYRQLTSLPILLSP